MLLNLSNHPSSLWSTEQSSQAIVAYNKVEDLAFPQIDPEMLEQDLDKLVEEYFKKIQEINPKAVHIMGEMTFVYRLVTRLKRKGVRCVASTTERISKEDGKGNKTSTFKFIKFRAY